MKRIGTKYTYGCINSNSSSLSQSMKIPAISSGTQVAMLDWRNTRWVSEKKSILHDFNQWKKGDPYDDTAI